MRGADRFSTLAFSSFLGGSAHFPKIKALTVTPPPHSAHIIVVLGLFYATESLGRILS